MSVNYEAYFAARVRSFKTESQTMSDADRRRMGRLTLKSDDGARLDATHTILRFLVNGDAFAAWCFCETPRVHGPFLIALTDPAL